MTRDGQAAVRRLRFGMVAGESSGDLLAAAVLRGLAEAEGGAAAAGIGGPAMVAAGFDAWWPAEALAVSGYAEVLREYPRLLRLRADLVARMRAERPALYVGVDAPDFNLGVEARLRADGLRTAHFVSPSIWAWRGGRIERIRRAVDHMLVVFPFEEALYRDAGIPATFVGHPLADQIPRSPDRQAARARLASRGVPAAGPLVALLPGSRGGEVRHIAPTFVAAARWMARRRPELRFVLPAATPRLRAMIAAQLGGGADGGADGGEALPLTVVEGGSHDVLAACSGVLVASGTATLEAALFGRPMVIAYRLHWLSHAIMKRMAYLPWIGLPNILARESLVPEFVQDAATPEALGAALLAQLDDDAGRERLARRFAAMHDELARGCARRAAEVLGALADGGRP